MHGEEAYILSFCLFGVLRGGWGIFIYPLLYLTMIETRRREGVGGEAYSMEEEEMGAFSAFELEWRGAQVRDTDCC